MPHERLGRPAAWTAFAVAAVLVGWLARDTPGTSDVVDFWLQWLNRVVSAGPIHGYAAIAADYPPGASATLWLVGMVASAAQVPASLVLKIVLYLFLLVTAGLLAIASKRPWLGTSALLAFALSAPALMYLDIFVAPFVIAAIWAARQGSTTPMMAFITGACLMKWQPLFVLPFAIVYLVMLRGVMPSDAWSRVAWRAAAVCGAIGAATLAIYGRPVVLALAAAGHHGHFSNFAANLPWIVGSWLERVSPGRYGQIAADGFVTIANASRRELRIMTGAALLAYGLTLWMYWKSRDRSVAGWLRYALVGYLAYFTLCSGVHENHLFLASLLSLGLAWEDPRFRWVAVVVIAAANLNLYAFYGWAGLGPVHSKIAGIDWTVWLAAANCVAFAIVAVRLLGSQDPHVDTQARRNTKV